MSRYQIIYSKRGFPLIAWKDKHEDAYELAANLKRSGYDVSVWKHSQTGAEREGQEHGAVPEGEREQKIVLVYPTEIYGMIADLPNGEPTQNGDRTSRYIAIAKGIGEKLGREVYAALIEEKNGLPERGYRYSLHIINDVDMTDCQTFSTDSFDPEDLEKLFASILKDLEAGQL